MPFNEISTSYKHANILESEVGLVLKSRTGTQSMAATVGARKVIKAGTLWAPVNTGETDPYEIGVVFEDYDMTLDEKYPISVVFQGRLLADRVSSDALDKKSAFADQGLYLV